MLRWRNARSGVANGLKAVYLGSIPGSASTTSIHLQKGVAYPHTLDDLIRIQVFGHEHAGTTFGGGDNGHGIPEGQLVPLLDFRGLPTPPGIRTWPPNRRASASRRTLATWARPPRTSPGASCRRRCSAPCQIASCLGPDCPGTRGPASGNRRRRRPCGRQAFHGMMQRQKAPKRAAPGGGDGGIHPIPQY